MSFQSFLEKVRAKPEHVKKRISLWTSFAVTAVIFAFWVSSFSVFHSSPAAQLAVSVKSAATPSQSMVASVSSFFTDIKELVFGAKKVTYSSVEVLPGKK